jgi:hypothetical protein
VTATGPPLRTLEEIAQELGVPFYRVKRAAASLHETLRLYTAEAVAVLRERVVKDQAREHRARQEGAGYWQALAGLRIAARQHRRLAGELLDVYRALRDHPPSVSASIHTLPERGFVLVSPPVAVLVSPLRRSTWRAEWPEAGLEAKGQGQAGAVLALRQEILTTYLALRADSEQDPQCWEVLDQLIRERRQRSPSDAATRRTEEA